MNTQQQAYVNGFVKRAAEYGFNEAEATGLLKQSGALNQLAALSNSGLSHAAETAKNLQNWRNSTAAGIKKLRNPNEMAKMRNIVNEAKLTGYDPVKHPDALPALSHIREHLPTNLPEPSDEFSLSLLNSLINKNKPTQYTKEQFQNMMRSPESLRSLEEAVASSPYKDFASGGRLDPESVIRRLTRALHNRALK